MPPNPCHPDTACQCVIAGNRQKSDQQHRLVAKVRKRAIAGSGSNPLNISNNHHWLGHEKQHENTDNNVTMVSVAKDFGQ